MNQGTLGDGVGILDVGGAAVEVEGAGSRGERILFFGPNTNTNNIRNQNFDRIRIRIIFVFSE